MTSGLFSGAILRGLAFRVLFFLSLALLPIGLIAVAQSQQISEQNRINGELSLLAITEQASFAESHILQEAFGAAEALGSIVKLYRNDTEACRRFVRAYHDATGHYGLVGFIPMDGVMTCASQSNVIDYSKNRMFLELLEDPSRAANPIEFDAVSGKPRTSITTPVYENETLVGFIILSVPFEAIDRIEEPELALTPVALMTFNKHGEILTTEHGLEVSADEVPANIALSLFAGQPQSVFKAENQKDLTRLYAVQSIVQGAVYSLSVWPENSELLLPNAIQRFGTVLPIAMWAASLVVAFWALNRLAIRHIRKLSRQMRRFALNRNLPENALGTGVPSELVDMESAFIAMGESILKDEAKQEDSLREKNILLKEVHHRVKNNLQLISSIMNMQIRQAKTDEASRVLRRLQERILGLATVHKNLYQNDDLVRVNAHSLLKEIVNQLLAVGLAPGSNVNVKQRYDDVWLDADDAAPLTLLTSEAITNALKYVAQESRSKDQLEISMAYDGPEAAVLQVANTKGGVPNDEGTGLGSRLIDAFARQLNGQVEVEETATHYCMTLRFPVPDRKKQVYDY